MLTYTIIGLTAATIALLFYYRAVPQVNQKQRWLLTGLRFITLACILSFLLIPVINYIRHYHPKPMIVFLKDTSASMTLNDGNRSKSEAVTIIARTLRQACQKAGYQVAEYAFADGLKGNSSSTMLLPTLAQLKEAVSSERIKAVFLLSDGWFRDTDISSISEVNLPLYTLMDTTRTHLADLEIVQFRHNRQGYRNEPVLFEADVKAAGYTGKASLQLSINGKVVKEKTVDFSQGSLQTVSFDQRFARTGIQHLELKLSSPDIREEYLSNNLLPDAMEILNDKDKLLILSDVPNWDTKFILDTVRENTRWEPISLIIKSDGLYQGSQKSPFSQWTEARAIVMVNYDNLTLSNAISQQISKAVDNGTGLLYYGLPVAGLGDLLPLKTSNVRSRYQGLLKLLPAAQTYAAFKLGEAELRDIPPLDYYYLTAKPNCEILAVMDNAQASPAIGLDASRKGKVLSFAFVNLWRWQMQSSEAAYRNTINRLITWLANTGTGNFTALYQPGYYSGEPITIKLSSSDETRQSRTNLAPRITVYRADRDSVFSDFLTYRNGEYSIEFQLDQPADYSFEIKDTATRQVTRGSFTVHTQNLEERDYGYNNPLLNWIASQTGARQLTLREAEYYQPVKAEAISQIERKEYSLYKKWYLISLFIISFCLELFFRRRWGLL